MAIASPVEVLYMAEPLAAEKLFIPMSTDVPASAVEVSHRRMHGAESVNVFPLMVACAEPKV